MSILEFYHLHTKEDTIKRFNINEDDLDQLLKANKVRPHSKTRNKTLAAIDQMDSSKINEILEFYHDHSARLTCSTFSLTLNQLKLILERHDVKVHSKSDTAQINLKNGSFPMPPSTAGKHQYWDGENVLFLTPEEAAGRDDLMPRGKVYNDEERAKKTEKERQTKKERYGDEKYNNFNQIKTTTFSHYGVNSYWQTKEAISNKSRNYEFEGEKFDSSWELALFIYAKDHGEEIEHEPFSLDYTYNGHKCKYWPDFLYKGQLVEVKGDHLLKDDKLYDYYNQGKNKLEAKSQCMKDHDVIVMNGKDVQFALKYVSETYGRFYLRQFKQLKCSPLLE